MKNTLKCLVGVLGLADILARLANVYRNWIWLRDYFGN